MSGDQCIVCGSRQWLRLPDPSARRSITTSGVIIDEPLGKCQCLRCGLGQRTEYPYLGDTDFYERQYANYYERPGTEIFNQQRYADIARWVSAANGDRKPDSIVEVGCGRGWTLREMQKIYPQAKIEGIEPSLANGEEARKAGIHVVTGKLDEHHIPERQYDLVFSNHVLQHTTDPVGVLKAMGAITSNRGLVIVTIQDASNISNELLYSDQNFSFLPSHLVGIAEKAGLRVLSWKRAPDCDSLRFSQMVVCARQDSESETLPGPVPQAHDSVLADLYQQRVQYLEAWSSIDDHLCRKTDGHQNIYNFGAGMFSYLLAGYCEAYWNRVTSCIVDNFAGQCVGKSVLPLGQVSIGDQDCIVMGTRPNIQKQLATRLLSYGWKTVCWDNFVEG